MSRAAYSAAMTGAVDAFARKHLLRTDGQEDLCFGIWHPSTGRTRKTALIERLIMPLPGERKVHGNVSFRPAYFERALATAAEEGGGLALLHSHPLGRGWQDMSDDDVVAEEGHAGATYGATRLPFVGLTIAGDGAWSARFWEKDGLRRYRRFDCATVRVIGDRLQITYMDQLAPPPRSTQAQVRTVSAWGEKKQEDLARLRAGVAGAGSVGGFIAEGLARTGFEDVVIVDYDKIETKNLDRLLYGTTSNVGQSKAPTLAEHLNARATTQRFRADAVIAAVYETEGFQAALDCDVIFSCVDRPWGRHVLNFIAYAHLIPVVDGGISVRSNRKGEIAAADWRAHTVTVNRRCMQCMGQYDSGLVQLERDGYLDDPTYIENLKRDHPLRVRENVFAFSMSCASLQMLQMLSLTLDPLGRPNTGEQLYHFVGGEMEPPEFGTCHPECLFPRLVARGDHSGFTVTGSRPVQYHSIQEKPDNPETRPDFSAGPIVSNNSYQHGLASI